MYYHCQFSSGSERNLDRYGNKKVEDAIAVSISILDKFKAIALI